MARDCREVIEHPLVSVTFGTFCGTAELLCKTTAELSISVQTGVFVQSPSRSSMELNMKRVCT